MNTPKEINNINDILKKIIDENITEFKKSGEFKVRTAYGSDKFYLDRVEGSYHMSLQSLIHYIMYFEGIYKEILNKKQYAELEIMIKESPEGIYFPNIDFESDDYAEAEEMHERLDMVYYSCIKYVGEYLLNNGFEVQHIFQDFIDIEDIAGEPEENAYNRVEVINEIKMWAGALEQFSDVIKDDKEVVLTAVKKISWTLEFASDRLKDDKDVVLASIKEYEHGLKFASERLRDDDKIIMKAIKKHCGMKFASERLKDNDEFVFNATRINDYCFKDASERLKNNKNYILKVLKEVPDVWRHVSDEIKSDNEFTFIAFKVNNNIVKSFLKKQRNNLRFMLRIFNENGLTLEYASDKIKDKAEAVFVAIKNCGLALQFASERLCDDYDIVMEAVKQHGWALRCASDRLTKDAEIVKTAVKNHGIAILYASEELINDNNFTKYLKDDRDLLKFAVRKWPNALNFASDKLRADREIVLAAVKVFGEALRYVSDELRSDKEIVYLALRQNIKALDYIAEELRYDLDIIRLVNYRLEYIKTALDSLQCNSKILKKSLSNNTLKIINDSHITSSFKLSDEKIIKYLSLETSAEYQKIWKFNIRGNGFFEIHHNEPLKEQLLSFRGMDIDPEHLKKVNFKQIILGINEKYKTNFKPNYNDCFGDYTPMVLKEILVVIADIINKEYDCCKNGIYCTENSHVYDVFSTAQYGNFEQLKLISNYLDYLYEYFGERDMSDDLNYYEIIYSFINKSNKNVSFAIEYNLYREPYIVVENRQALVNKLKAHFDTETRLEKAIYDFRQYIINNTDKKSIQSVWEDILQKFNIPKGAVELGNEIMLSHGVFYPNSIIPINELTSSLVPVKGGTFLMGADKIKRDYNEKKIREVTISDFFVARDLVTRAQWEAVMGYSHGNELGLSADMPEINVTWKDTEIFLKRLNYLTGKNYRILSEAEWEFIVRRDNEKKSGKNIFSKAIRFKNRDFLDWCTDFYYNLKKDSKIKIVKGVLRARSNYFPITRRYCGFDSDTILFSKPYCFRIAADKK
jgi:hypothetical protein